MCTRRPLSRGETGAQKSSERLSCKECVKSVPCGSLNRRVLYSISIRESSLSATQKMVRWLMRLNQIST